jgi:DNA ligase-4
VFDILYLDGQDLTALPFNKRIEKLQGVFTPETGRLELIERLIGNSQKDVSDELDRAITSRLEGLVLKDLLSPYEFGKRSARWLKVKPEYIEGLNDDLDLLIIGAYYGKRNKGMVSTFLCGIKSADKFLSFCKIGSGYTFDELQVIRDSILPYSQSSRSHKPSNIVLADSVAAKEVPDLFIDPNHSIVVQVKATEIVPTNKYATKYTLRFPRYVCIRRDKDVLSAMTLDEMHHIRKLAEGRLAIQTS